MSLEQEPKIIVKDYAKHLARFQQLHNVYAEFLDWKHKIDPEYNEGVPQYIYVDEERYIPGHYEKKKFVEAQTVTIRVEQLLTPQLVFAKYRAVNAIFDDLQKDGFEQEAKEILETARESYERARK